MPPGPPTPTPAVPPPRASLLLCLTPRVRKEMKAPQNGVSPGLLRSQFNVWMKDPGCRPFAQPQGS